MSTYTIEMVAWKCHDHDFETTDSKRWKSHQSHTDGTCGNFTVTHTEVW